MADADATTQDAELAHARALLSPEERAILDEPDEVVATGEDDDDEVEVVDLAKDAEGEGGEAAGGAADADEAGEGEAPDAAGADAADAAGSAADQDAGAAEGEADAGQAPADPNLPRLSFALPDDFEDKRTALDTRFVDLESKFEDGELSRAEYAAEHRKLTREQSDLDRVQMRADMAKDSYDRELTAYHERVANTWLQSFVAHAAWAKSPEGGGINYIKGDPLAKLLGEEADALIAANPKMGPDEVWRKADESLRAKLGLTAPAAAAAAAAKPAAADAAKAAKAAVQKARKPDTSAVPKTLAGVTGEGGPDSAGGDKFAALDKLFDTGKFAEAERAFAAMPEAAREAYLARV